MKEETQHVKFAEKKKSPYSPMVLLILLSSYWGNVNIIRWNISYFKFLIFLVFLLMGSTVAQYLALLPHRKLWVQFQAWDPFCGEFVCSPVSAGFSRFSSISWDLQVLQCLCGFSPGSSVSAGFSGFSSVCTGSCLSLGTSRNRKWMNLSADVFLTVFTLTATPTPVPNPTITQTKRVFCFACRCCFGVWSGGKIEFKLCKRKKKSKKSNYIFNWGLPFRTAVCVWCAVPKNKQLNQQARAAPRWFFNASVLRPPCIWSIWWQKNKNILPLTQHTL